MAVPSWFNYTVYFQNKAADMGVDALELKALFEAAGYVVNDADSMYSHFLSYGNSEGISPNQYFSVSEYLYNKAADFYADLYGVDKTKSGWVDKVQVSEQMMQTMLNAMNQSGMSPWDHYVKYGAMEGVNPSTGFDASLYLAAKVASMNSGEGFDGRTDWTAAELLDILEEQNLTPLTHYLEYGVDEELGYTPTAVGVGQAGNTFLLTELRDTVYGTTANDQIHAQVDGDLSDGDYIDGGGGYDTLYATMGSESSAVQPMVFNVEKIVLQSQGVTTDVGSNYPAGTVHFDAGRVAGKVNSELYTSLYGSDQGLQYLANNDSRADLVVENVRSNTTDMTIGWYNADPGDVDFTVYFDSQYLKPESQSKSGTLNIELMDMKSANDTNSANPLKTNPYNVLKFTFTPNGGTATEVVLTLENYNDETNGGTAFTYTNLVAAINAAIVKAGYEGVISATLGNSFNASTSSTTGNETWSGTGNLVVLSTDSGSFTDPYWNATGVIPGDSAYRTIVRPDGETTCPLIVTDIDLDNVGRVQWTDLYQGCLPDEQIFGSEAGDLVVGAQDGRSGIEKFVVTVDQGSWLSSLSSTNNTLRAVTVQKGDINGDGFAGNKLPLANDTNVGSLFIGSSLELTADEMAHWTVRPALLSTDGLTDVKYFDATGYEGHLNIGAQLTAEGYAKYLHDVDGIDTVYSGYAPNGSFEYNLGTNNDILNMTVNGGMAADNDFVLNINANAGNDFINFAFTDITHNNVLDSSRLGKDSLGNVTGNGNVTINGGTGDDTVWSWGDGAVTVNGGDGVDAIYVGQLGDANPDTYNTNSINHSADHNAVWALNVDPNHKQIDFRDDGAQAHSNDFLSTTATTAFTALAAGQSGYSVYVSVDFLGFTGTYAIDGVTVSSTGAIGNVSNLAINAAIINAIKNDPTLSKVLVAKDGAGYGLIVESLIDGLMAAGDLDITFYAWNGNNATATTAVTENGTTNYVAALADAAVDVLMTTGQEYTTAPGGGAPSVLDLTFETATDLAIGDVITITIGGQTYSGTVAAGATNDAMLLDALGSATLVGSDPAVDLSDSWTFADDTGPVAGLIVATSVANDGQAGQITIVQTPVDLAVVSGSDKGTYSINRVEGGLGNDVIVLNAGSHVDDYTTTTADYDINDTLVISNLFGHDSIFNFDYGLDKVDATALGATAATQTTINVLNNAAVNLAVGATELTIAQGITAAGASWDSANNIGVLAVRIADNGGTATNTWQFFQINNANADTTIATDEIRSLGTMTFTDDDAAAIALGNTAGFFA